MSQDRQAAVDQLMLEIHDAIGSFVAHYAGQSRQSGAGDPVQGRIGHAAGGESDRTAPVRSAEAELAASLRDGTEDTAGMPYADLGFALRGHHVRAGRALLDWTMTDLADASGLSLSTVRRLEQDAEGVLTRNRRSAAHALQEAGICFLPLSNGAVAVAKPAEAMLAEAVAVP